MFLRIQYRLSLPSVVLSAKPRLIALYPCIGVGSGEEPVKTTQLFYKAVCSQVAVALWVKLYGRNKGGLNI
ncbi:hypothetical protein IE994_15225 [Enterobacter hormaechei]|nr:hypothetical protein [Enterobacter hormaechei]MBD3717188.1 hypothetical protein [Enterobacter hormaechei]